MRSAPPARCPPPGRRKGLAFLVLLLVPVPSAVSDVVQTRGGLRLEGQVHREDSGALVVATAEGLIRVPPSEVVRWEVGREPRRALLDRRGRLDASDLAGWVRLALEAEAEGESDLAQDAYRRVLLLDSDHRAARRALGFERLGSEWVAYAEARRRQGLVLYEGLWRLPAEVELLARGARRSPEPAPPGTAEAALDLVALSILPGDPRAEPASRALLRVDAEVLRRGLLSALESSPMPALRREAARRLGEMGDNTALLPLIQAAVEDPEATVRGQAAHAAAAFAHEDTAIPWIRALLSSKLSRAAHAAQALAILGDRRAAGFIVRRMTSHGASARSTLTVLNQVSYVADYDVAVAQASNIADPVVRVVNEGVVLDAHVTDVTLQRTWLEPILLQALGDLVDAEFASGAHARAWWLANRERLPRFEGDPRASDRPPRPKREVGGR